MTETSITSAGRDGYLTEAMFCERFHLTPRTAQRWRTIGEGPSFVRLGPRRIVYRLSDVENWAAANTFRHRSHELMHAAEAAAA